MELFYLSIRQTSLVLLFKMFKIDDLIHTAMETEAVVGMAIYGKVKPVQTVSSG